MNIITSQMQQQKPEIQEMVCQIHQQEIVALDLDTQEKGSFQYLCCKCLVEKMNNNKISTIEQTKDRIYSLKTQRYENKMKEIQLRLDYFKIILDQIMEFKCNFETILEKIYSQIKAQIFTIQREKQSLQDNFQIQFNFQEDVKSLSEFLSTDSQEKLLEIQYDGQFIDEIIKQFDLLFNGAAYFQTIDAFKDAKQKINEFNENNQIELHLLQNKNNQKTPSLNKICPTHDKEIIMIDIDSKNRKLEERFACVDCINDHPNCQYRTIEKINQQWNHTKKQQDRILSDLKIKRQEKQEKLNQQIAVMRKNYNQQLNEISEKLITEFSLQTNKPIEINKFQQTSLQQLTNEELLSNINQIIQNDKENLVQDSKIEYLKSKDTLFQKEIESRLEHLKQYDQLDIQESLNILIYKMTIKFKELSNYNKKFRRMQTQIKNNQSAKKIQKELINSSKYIQYYQNLLNESIQKFQEHLTKIKTFESILQSIPNNSLCANLQKQINDYKYKFEKDFQQFIKFFEIENLEKSLETLQQDNEKLQLERNQVLESIEKNYKLKIQQQNNIIQELEKLVKQTEDKLKNKVEEEQLLNEKLKEENAKNAKFQLKLNDQQVKHDNEIKSLNEKINELKIKALKPNLLKDDQWMNIFYILQEKTKKLMKQSVLIYQGTKDGLNSEQFWNKVNGKSNLLMVFQSKTDYIFGAYSPSKWESNRNSFVEDDTLSSFIFSQTHDQVYPLKQEYKKYAIYCGSNYGPIFGNGNDICIYSNFTDGLSRLGHSYQFNQYKNQKDDPYLFGQNKPEIKECEIYQLQFL